MSLIFHDNSLLVLLWCFNHFIIHVGDSRLEKAYKERCHTLHQPYQPGRYQAIVDSCFLVTIYGFSTRWYAWATIS